MCKPAHLVTQGLAIGCVQVGASQCALMLGVQLLEPVQRHDSLLAYQILGVAGQAGHSGQYRIDQVRSDQLAHRCQGRAYCSKVAGLQRSNDAGPASGKACLTGLPASLKGL